MAHRLHAAGVPTQLSEHFVTYHVIPKPEPSCRSDTSVTCCLRPNFLYMSQSAIENRCNPEGQHHLGNNPQPVHVACSPEVAPLSNDKCCLSKTCQCCVCRPTPSSKRVRMNKCGCCVSETGCGGHRNYEVKIKLPRDQDKALEQKMVKKMNKLKKDIQKFDETLAHFEKKNVSRPCAAEVPKICYYREILMPQEMCCIPMSSNEKHRCLPILGRMKKIC